MKLKNLNSAPCHETALCKFEILDECGVIIVLILENRRILFKLLQKMFGTVELEQIISEYAQRLAIPREFNLGIG